MLFEKIQLEPGEEVLKKVRRHWFTLVAEMFSVVLMFFSFFFILFLIAIFPHFLTSFEISLADYASLIAYATAVWSIFGLMVGFTIWTHYYLDLWIITDRRIIVVDQVRFFNRNVGIFRFERLQDIEFEIKGFIPTLLNYGTIKAQTASSFESNFKGRGLPDPRGLQALIQKATDTRLRKIRLPDE